MAWANTVQAAYDHGFTYHPVQPQAWQAALPGMAQFKDGKHGKPKTAAQKKAAKKRKDGLYLARKKHLLGLARRLFPGLPLVREKDQGIADAAFIAVYAAHRFYGIPLPW